METRGPGSREAGFQREGAMSGIGDFLLRLLRESRERGRTATGKGGGGPLAAGAVCPASVMGLPEDEPAPEVSWLCMGRRACHLVVAGPAPMKLRPGL